MDDGNGGGNGEVWVSIGEAARRLGISRQAVQGRLRRGTLETRMEAVGNRQRLRVRLPQLLPESAAQEVTQPAAQPAAAAPDAALIAELRARVAHLEGEVMFLRAELARRRWPGLRRWWRRLIEGNGSG